MANNKHENRFVVELVTRLNRLDWFRLPVTNQKRIALSIFVSLNYQFEFVPGFALLCPSTVILESKKKIVFAE